MAEGGLIGYLVTIITLVVIIGTVVVPTIRDVLATAGIGGTAGLLLGMVPALFALLVIAYVAAPFRGASE